MTRPTEPPAAGSGEVVEIDAMDGREWEQGQRTPQASDANLAALVKESTTMQEPVAPARLRRTSVVARGRVTGPVPVPAPAPRAGDPPPASAVSVTRPTQSPPAATRRPAPVTTPPAPVTTPPAPVTTPPAPVTTPPAPAEKITLATPRPAPPAVSARPAISSAATPDPSAAPPKPEPGLGPPPRPVPGSALPRPAPGSSLPRLAPGSALPRPAPGSALPRPAPGSALPRPAPGPSPSSSRPLSPMQVGVARAGSALDEARPASLADQEAASGEQPAQGDLGEPALGEPALPGPVPVATRAEPIRLLPLPPPTEPTPSPDVFAGPDREAPPPPARDRRERSTTSEPTGLLAAGDRRERSTTSEPTGLLAAGDRRERSTTSEPQGLLAAASSRRRVLWIGGAAGGVVLVLILVLVGGRTSDTVVSSAQVEGLAQGSTGAARIAVAAPVEPASPPRPPVEPDTSDVQAPPAPAPPPQPSAAAIRPGQSPARRASDKKLVLEYAEPTGEIAKPVLAARTTEDPAVARARGAYLSGNQKLFAGDAQGAIRAYRQALDFYPGYVGGYRGLGLAYAQLGNAPRALDAFGTYVSLVPGAKDIALIKKRIARLSGK